MATDNLDQPATGEIAPVDAAIIDMGRRVIEAFQLLDMALDIDPATMSPELMRKAMLTVSLTIAGMGPSIATISAFVSARSSVDQRPPHAGSLNS